MPTQSSGFEAAECLPRGQVSACRVYSAASSPENFLQRVARPSLAGVLQWVASMTTSQREILSMSLLPLLIPVAFFSLVYGSSFTSGYGYFIDEFYYLACAARPDFGYVDHPPFAPWVLTAFTSIFGTSLAALRLVPAVAGAVTVYLTGRLARRLPGAGLLAESLAALAIACVPVLWSFSSVYSMNAFEPVLALLMVHSLLSALEKNERRQWLLLGLWMGLGVLNKHTFVIIVLVLGLGLILSGKARALWSRGAGSAAATGSVIVLPNLLWQLANGFPSLEFYRVISTQKNVYTPPVDFVLAQLLSMNAVVVGLSVVGVVAAFRFSQLREFRLLGLAFLLGFSFFLSTGSSRVDRLLFAYCWVVPLGAWWLSQLAAKRCGAVAVVVITGVSVWVMAVSIPLSVTWLSPEKTLAYTEKLGINTEMEAGNKPPLPQLMADRIGWEKKVEMVVAHYQELPGAVRAQTLVSAGNYGQAGALELFGKSAGLGEVMSPHNSYYLWSRELLARRDIQSLLHLGTADSEATLKKYFHSVEVLPGRFENPYVTNHEQGLRVYLCQQPKQSVAQTLEDTRFYY